MCNTRIGGTCRCLGTGGGGLGGEPVITLVKAKVSIRRRSLERTV